MINLRIGKIGENLSTTRQKYVVALENHGSDLVFYAHQVYTNCELPAHKLIATKFFNLPFESILGGGVMHYNPKTYELIGAETSDDFGATPTAIMNKFKQKILKAYQEINPEIKSLEFDCQDNDVRKNHQWPEIDNLIL